MTMIIDPTVAEEQTRRLRAERGIDLFDEVWDGEYFMSPSPNPFHQTVLFRLHKAIDLTIDERGMGRTFQEVNITDRPDDWTRNYRIPDLAVFLNGNPAIERETHFLGGPDFAVEILSEGDRAREKLDFYAKVGVRELLIIDRNPWGLELHRLAAGSLNLVRRLDPDSPGELASEVLSLTFRLVSGADRPLIHVSQAETGSTWTI